MMYKTKQRRSRHHIVLPRKLTVERPDEQVIIDFLDEKYGVQVKLALDYYRGELRVEVIATDDVNTTLEDKIYDVPLADTRR